MHHLRRLRARIKPEVRDWLDGFGLLFAVTLFLCLIQAAYDGVVHRVRLLDAPPGDLDKWITRQNEPNLTRPEAIRRLVELGLKVKK